MKNYQLEPTLSPERVKLAKRRLPVLRFPKHYNGLEVSIVPSWYLKEISEKLELARQALLDLSR